MRTRILYVSVALFSLALGACRPDDQRTDSIDPTSSGGRASMSAEAVARLDSGNVAYRAGDYEGAMVHYRRVTELEPDHSAGWFGVSMVQRALGNQASADSAYERVQSLAPGASLVHPTEADTLP